MRHRARLRQRIGNPQRYADRWWKRVDCLSGGPLVSQCVRFCGRRTAKGFLPCCCPWLPSAGPAGLAAGMPTPLDRPGTQTCRHAARRPWRRRGRQNACVLGLGPAPWPRRGPALPGASRFNREWTWLGSLGSRRPAGPEAGGTGGRAPPAGRGRSAARRGRAVQYRGTGAQCGLRSPQYRRQVVPRVPDRGVGLRCLPWPARQCSTAPWPGNGCACACIVSLT